MNFSQERPDSLPTNSDFFRSISFGDDQGYKTANCDSSLTYEQQREVTFGQNYSDAR
jgi:hypothetical protein